MSKKVGAYVCQDSPRSSSPINIKILVWWALPCLSHASPNMQRYFQLQAGAWAHQATHALKAGQLCLKLLNEALRWETQELWRWTRVPVSFHGCSYFILHVSWLVFQVTEWNCGIWSFKSREPAGPKRLTKILELRYEFSWSWNDLYIRMIRLKTSYFPGFMQTKLISMDVCK